jgi:hypothetical protein
VITEAGICSLWRGEEYKAIIQHQEKKFEEIRVEIDRLEAAGGY